MLNYSEFNNNEKNNNVTENIKNFLDEENSNSNNIAVLNSNKIKSLYDTNSLQNNDNNKFVPLKKENIHTLSNENSKPNNKQQNVVNSNTIDNKKFNETIDKLNHIIFMLEKQQDDKTDTVVEELILYLFLGFFIIYIIDTFFKAGKYVR